MPIYDALTPDALLALAKTFEVPPLVRAVHVTAHLPVDTPEGSRHVLWLESGEVICSGEAFDRVFQEMTRVAVPRSDLFVLGIPVYDYRRAELTPPITTDAVYG